MIEISEVRKRVRQAIDQAKRGAADRRERTAEATRRYEVFLEQIATPVFRMFAGVLKAEGHPFTLLTPQGKVRLEREPSGDFIELELDTIRNPPAVVGRTRHTAGRDVTSSERPLADSPVSALTDENVVEFVVAELQPFLAR